MKVSSWAMLAVVTLGLAACSPANPGGDGSSGSDASDTGTMAEGGDALLEAATPDSPGATCGSMIGSCNPVTNTGCPTGQGCYIFNNGSNMVTAGCRPRGMGGYGDACATPNDCLEGFSCLNSVCTRLCCGVGDDDRCRTGTGGMLNTACTPNELSFPNMSSTGIFTCQLIQRCDWFTQNCANGGNCRPVDATGTTQCRTAGNVREGGDCSMDPDLCVRGTICINNMTGSGSSCRKICNPLAGPSTDASVPDGGISMTCPSGQMCGGVSMTPRTFGVCIPM